MCFWCCCCGCRKFGINRLTTVPGILKIIEVGLGTICSAYASRAVIPGNILHYFILGVYWSLMTSTILLFCYIVSDKSYVCLKKSIFEIVFNIIASFICVIQSICLGIEFHISSLSKYISTPVTNYLLEFFAKENNSSASHVHYIYLLGGVIGFVYACDAYVSFKECAKERGRENASGGPRLGA